MPAKITWWFYPTGNSIAISKELIEQTLGKQEKQFKVNFTGNVAALSDSFIKAKSDIRFTMEDPNGHIELSSVEGKVTVTSSMNETNPIILFVTNYSGIDTL